MDVDESRRVLQALEEHGVRYVVFGGVAVNLHGLARATQDIDLFIEPEAGNIERHKAALRSVYPDPSIDEITAEDLLGEYPAVQYVPPEGAFHVDILTRLGEAFAWGDLQAQRVPFEGLSVSVATPATLYRMKKGTVRLKDRLDAEELRRRFALPED